MDKVSDELSRFASQQCEHPKLIKNKYTGDLVSVPCGKCNACLLNKTHKNTLLCSIEEAYHKYTFFITLTYSDEYIPTMTYELSHNSSLSENDIDDFLQPCPVFDFYDRNGNYMFSRGQSAKYMARLSKKCKLGNNKLSYLDYGDVQKYLKRLRYKLSTFSSDSVRYYAVGEYGPKTFRAHWHILLYFSDDAIAENIIEISRDCWKFGLVDISASRHSSASYLAGYVNSYICVPELYQVRGIRPRSFHSFHFGLSPFESDKQKLYASPMEYLDKKILNLFNGFVSARFTSRIRCYFFPKCIGFSTATDESLYNRYTVWKRYKSLWNNATLSVIEHLRYLYMFRDSGLFELTQAQNDFLDEIASYSTYDLSILLGSKDKFYSFFYCLFHLSRHFIGYVCDGREELIRPRIQLIKKFYKDCEYGSMKQQYLLQEEYSEKYGSTSFELFYDFGYIDDYRSDDDPILSTIREFNAYKLKDLIKHKELNDLNGYFINNN